MNRVAGRRRERRRILRRPLGVAPFSSPFVFTPDPISFRSLLSLSLCFSCSLCFSASNTTQLPAEWQDVPSRPCSFYNYRPCPSPPARRPGNRLRSFVPRSSLFSRRWITHHDPWNEPLSLSWPALYPRIQFTFPGFLPTGNLSR